jgi:hypothetical protein
MQESITPPHNRLVAYFVSDDDIKRELSGSAAELNTYFSAQVMRRLEYSSISTSQFSDLTRQVRATYQAGTQKPISSATLAISEELLNKQLKQAYPDAGAIDKLRVGEAKSLGLFQDEPNHVGFLFMSRYSGKVNGRSFDYMMASAISYVLVKGRTLTLYTGRMYKSPDDMAWVNRSAKQWADALLKAN